MFTGDLRGRLAGSWAGDADPYATAGALPPYAMSAYAIDHHPVELGLATGHWRGGGHVANVFARECFVDELAHAASSEPVSFRIGMLGGEVRLARCLSTAASLGGWEGGVPGSGQGIAAHAMRGSRIAVLAEAHYGDGGEPVVDRLVAAVDCGRMVNPDLVRQQIESGLILGLSAATGMTSPVVARHADRAHAERTQPAAPGRHPRHHRRADPERGRIRRRVRTGGAGGRARGRQRADGLDRRAGPPPAAAGTRMTPANHPPIPPRKIGVLLINLGTPDAADARRCKRYLAEFLSDRRVVEIPQLLWQPILRGIVLTTRPEEIGACLSTGLARGRLAARRDHRARRRRRWSSSSVPMCMVDWAMRYGNPAIGDRLAALKAAGCERILLAPLYPQYCAATTATANDKAFLALAAMRWQPAIRTLPPYHDDPRYIAALKASVEASLAALDFTPDAVVASFHGMPQRTLELGDPYHCQCRKTARLLGEAMGRELDGRVSVALRAREMAGARDRQGARANCRARA